MATFEFYTLVQLEELTQEIEEKVVEVMRALAGGLIQVDCRTCQHSGMTELALSGRKESTAPADEIRCLLREIGRLAAKPTAVEYTRDGVDGVDFIGPSDEDIEAYRQQYEVRDLVRRIMRIRKRWNPSAPELPEDTLETLARALVALCDPPVLRGFLKRLEESEAA